MQKFKHIISLGFFCSVAMELERKGLRTASYPFDWVISDSFENILKLIDNDFENFLEYDNLYQENDKSHYYNSITGVHFYHDFNAFEPLSKQIGNVQKKYQRRIKRFYEDIKEPTLFVRYCSNKEEENYVSNNEEKILELLQSFNPQNQILYIESTTTDKKLNISSLGGVFAK